MEKKSLMPSSLVILAMFLCLQVCCCVRPRTDGLDMEAAASQNCKCVELQEEVRKLKEELKKKSSSSCNETSLEGRSLVDGASQLGPNLLRRYLAISKELSAEEFQQMKDLAKDKFSDLNLQDMTDPYPFLSELERVGKGPGIVELLEIIQRHDLVEKLGVSFNAGTNDQSLSGERDSSRDWDPHLDQNVQGGGLSLYLNLQCSNDESTCLDVHAGNPPGYSMDGTPKTAVEANDNSSVTAKSSPSHFEQENKNEVEVRRNYPSSPLHSVKTFEELPLSEQLHHGVYDMGFKKPSKIQGTVLPELLADPVNNLIMISPPGAGKTTASVLSMLSRVDATQNFTQVIFLSPTYELALQTGQVTEKMSKFCPEIKIGYAVRGEIVPPGHIVTYHILIGTPATVFCWISRYKVVDPREIKMLVVDAADAMIEIQGHQDHCIRIYKKLAKDCQIVLCSDTYDDELMNFANRVVLHPKVICLNLNEEIHDNVKQVYVVCQDQTKKQQALSNMYGLVSIGQCIVFCGTRNSALCLALEMTAEGHSVALLTDEITLEERLAVLNRFRDGREKLLITSNVCPRGIDVEQVTAVVNYDMPEEPTVYLHRICRTGWLGRNCIAVNLIDGFSWSINIMKKIEEHFGWKISLLKTNDVEKLEKGNEDCMLETGLFAFGFVVFLSKK